MRLPNEILVAVAKRPIAGSVKTRLGPVLAPEEAAAFYEALLRDILDQTAAIAPGRIAKGVAVTPPDAIEYFRALAPPGFAIIPQEGPGLAERLSNLFVRLSREGHARIVVRNTDSPFLAPEYLLDAFERLERCDAVFGPDGGGGYNLVGLRAPQPELFLGITMSTRTVVDETLARAGEKGLRVELLEAGRDVDDPLDLDWLESELRKPGSTAARDAVPRTAAALRSMGRL